MNLVRLGRVVRTLRRRRGWRQVDLGRAAVCSQQVVSMVECGSADRVSLRTTARIAAALEAELDIVVRWRGGQLESLLDEGHAELTGQVAALLAKRGWRTAVEVSYAIGREAGSIEVLASHPAAHALLVVEVKTELLSAEATIRKLDEKVRLAAPVAWDRFGWPAAAVSRLLVLPATSTARDAVARHCLFDRAAPQQGWAVKRWIAGPSGPIAGILFVRPTKPHGRIRHLTSRRRIRLPPRLGPERAEAAPALQSTREAASGRG